MGKQWKQWQALFSWAPKLLQADCSHKIKRRLLLGRKAMTNLDIVVKSRDITLPIKVCVVKLWLFQQPCSPAVFSSRMWEFNNKKGWASTNWCLRTVVLEKTLEGPLDSKEIKPVNPKGNQHWIFIGRSDVEPLILWPPDAKNWLIGEDPDAGKDWRQKETRGERGQDGWMASQTQRTCIWAKPGRRWRTGKPCMLQSMRSQRVGNDWTTEQQQRMKGTNRGCKEEVYEIW